jgi:hypothetical protein
MELRYQKRSERIATLTEIWRQVLGDPSLDENSDLFENGGSSLLVLQIVGQIYDVLGVDVKVRTVFTYASPRRLSDSMEDEIGQGVFSAVESITDL